MKDDFSGWACGPSEELAATIAWIRTCICCGMIFWDTSNSGHHFDNPDFRDWGFSGCDDQELGLIWQQAQGWRSAADGLFLYLSPSIRDVSLGFSPLVWPLLLNIRLWNAGGGEHLELWCPAQVLTSSVIASNPYRARGFHWLNNVNLVGWLLFSLTAAMPEMDDIERYEQWLLEDHGSEAIWFMLYALQKRICMRNSCYMGVQKLWMA